MKPQHDVLTHMKYTSNRGGPVGGGIKYWLDVLNTYRPISSVQPGKCTNRTVVTKLDPVPLWEIEEESFRRKRKLRRF